MESLLSSKIIPHFITLQAIKRRSRREILEFLRAEHGVDDPILTALHTPHRGTSYDTDDTYDSLINNVASLVAP